MASNLPEDLRCFLTESRLSAWLNTLPEDYQQAVSQVHGHAGIWDAAVDSAPMIGTSVKHFNQSSVELGEAAALNEEQHAALLASVQALIPWRKGPYRLFGLDIDTEWRSDWKWERVSPHLMDLTDALVLDVGCGSGYHMWRMYGAGAKAVIGIDPTDLFNAQFALVKRYVPDAPVWMLPLKSENLPDFRQKGFDTVFSMGVLYHRRDPLGHLQELKRALRAGGQLVLETLVVEGDASTVLMPNERYAKMRNVWFIPSVDMLVLWLKRLGFVDVRVVDVNVTSINEQRCTAWSKGESLSDFLDVEQPTLTIEGYPAPMRATVIAHTPV